MLSKSLTSPPPPFPFLTSPDNVGHVATGYRQCDRILRTGPVCVGVSKRVEVAVDQVGERIRHRDLLYEYDAFEGRHISTSTSSSSSRSGSGVS